MAKAGPPPTSVELGQLGPTPQAALRRLVDAFENRGWRDDGEAALAIVRLLQDEGGSASSKRVARAVPRVFMARNTVLRRDIESMLTDLTARTARARSSRS